MQIARIGLDLAKYVFAIHGVDAHGKTMLRKTLRRHAVSTFFANLPPCLIGMEASNGAHFWAKAISELGHDARLISPQFVTPYVKSNKNDRNDAEAICEAIGRPNMHQCRLRPRPPPERAEPLRDVEKPRRCQNPDALVRGTLRDRDDREKRGRRAGSRQLRDA